MGSAAEEYKEGRDDPNKRHRLNFTVVLNENRNELVGDGIIETSSITGNPLVFENNTWDNDSVVRDDSNENHREL